MPDHGPAVSSGERLLCRLGSDEAVVPTEAHARVDGSTVALRLVGEISADTTPVLRRAVAPCLDGVAVATLDLSGTSFLDSLGIAWLVQVQAELATRGGRVEVVRASRLVRRVLDAVVLSERLGLPPAP